MFDGIEQGTNKIEALFTDEALWSRASADSLEYFERNHSSSEVLARYARVIDELVS